MAPGGREQARLQCPLKALSNRSGDRTVLVADDSMLGTVGHMLKHNAFAAGYAAAYPAEA